MEISQFEKVAGLVKKTFIEGIVKVLTSPEIWLVLSNYRSTFEDKII